MEITLGTVQFGMSYGVSNKGGELSSKKIQKICQKFRSYGYNSFDTARSYGRSEKELSNVICDGDIITTKIAPNLNQYPSEEWIDVSLKKSLNELKVEAVETLLFHRSTDLCSVPLKILEKKVLDLKSEGTVKNFGISVNTPEELNVVLNYYPIDFVQLPLNIFDQRFLKNGMISRLKDMNVKIEVRSVFLQGLLLMDSKDINPYFIPWLHKFNEFKSWSDTFKTLNKLDLCISFVRNIREIDRVIFGVQSENQLDQIMQSFQNRIIEDYPDISSSDERLVCPFLWNLS